MWLARVDAAGEKASSKEMLPLSPGESMLLRLAERRSPRPRGCGLSRGEAADLPLLVVVVVVVCGSCLSAAAACPVDRAVAVAVAVVVSHIPCWRSRELAEVTLAKGVVITPPAPPLLLVPAVLDEEVVVVAAGLRGGDAAERSDADACAPCAAEWNEADRRGCEREATRPLERRRTNALLCTGACCREGD